MARLGTDIKVVWIASAPRCGSMWSFNVTRQIVRAAGLEYLPTRVPHSDKAMAEIGHEAFADPATDRVRVLKVHGQLRPDLPFSCFIVLRRDLRDALMSYMRFMRLNFENALAYIDNAAATYRHYGAFPQNIALPIDYCDIIARPCRVVREIARFLNAEIDDATILDIVQTYSKDNVQNIIARTELDIATRDRQGHQIARDERVVFPTGFVRAFDVATGFQSGHVSQYQDGDWRNILTPDQQAQLNALIQRKAAH